MRAIAEEAFALVKAYKGSHSGEHGDGLVRSEFHEKMYGARTVRLFEEVKDRFDPQGVMNPGKIVRARPMNDRALFRYKPDYRVPEIETALDWSAYPGAGRGFQGAVEMCNNNGECRKHVGRRDVPLLPHHRQRARRDARARQLAQARHLRPARPQCADQRCHAGDDAAVRVLQGLPARVPDRRRHGEDEDRGARRLRRAPRPVAARPPGRVSAALCALCRAHGRADERARQGPGPRPAERAPRRLLRQAPPAALAQRCVRPALPAAGRGRAGAAHVRRQPLPHPTRGEGNLGGERGRARSRCSPIPSTPTSSPRTCAMRWRC